jgi:hypothetical protein
MIDLTTVIGDAAAVVDPRGENEDISILCGLIAWAVDHPDEYSGWDAETLSAAIRWNFGADAAEADEIAGRLIGVGW